MGSITLLVGGVRSGKSSLAVDIGRRHHGPVVFLATAEAFDDEMCARVSRHRAERPAWPVVEEPRRLAAAVAGVPPDALLIVDCLTVWVATCMHHGDEPDASAIVDALVRRPGPSVVVSNEVGLGVHPSTELGREYRDLLGRVNQTVAAAAATVLFFAAGRAVRLDDPWELL